jgi:hypothetical protein
MHNYKPNQKVKVITIQLAIPTDVDESDVYDEISMILSEGAMIAPDTNILDWRYETDIGHSNKMLLLSDEPEEGEAFALFDLLTVNKK